MYDATFFRTKRESVLCNKENVVRKASEDEETREIISEVHPKPSKDMNLRKLRRVANGLEKS